MARKILFIQFWLILFSLLNTFAQVAHTPYQKAKQKLNLCKKYDKNGRTDSLMQQARAGLKLSYQIHNDSLSSAFNNYIGDAFQTNQLDSAISYYHTAFMYANNIHNNDLAILALMGSGNAYEYKGANDSVYSYVLNIEKYLKMVNNDDTRQTVNSMLANIYSDHNQYEKAISYYLINIRYNKKINNPRGVGVALSNIGNTYLQMSRSDKALPYFKEAITNLSNYKMGLIVVNDNIGVSFTNLNKPDSAIQYHLKAIRLARAIKDSSDIYAAYEKLGAALVLKKEYSEAENYLSQALAYSLKSKEATGVIDGYTYLGQIKNAQKKYADAQSDFKQALDYAINTKHTERENEIYRMLAENQFADHRYIDAYRSEVKYYSTSDSLAKESAKNSITELASQYQSENKQQQISLLQQKGVAEDVELQEQKRTKYFLIASLIFVMIIVGLTIRGYRLKQRANVLSEEKNKELESKNSELKVLNDRLDEANQSKTKLFSILSHDLRAPIGSMFQFLNIQKNYAGKLNEEQQQLHNKRIIESGENLLDTMEDILIWSKSQMNAFSLQMRTESAYKVISDTIDLQRDFASEKQITLKMDCPEGLAIKTDLNFLSIVLRNIVNNGIKFTPAGGTILITGESGDNAICFKINDSGKGMTPEQVSDLFEWSSIRSDSSGLGLKLALEFTNRLGGDIKVYSAINNGTTFTVTLPQNV